MFRKFLFALCLVPCALCLGPAHAELRVDIVAGNIEPIPIAIQRFEFSRGDDAIAREIREVVENNLRSTGLFRIINLDAHPQRVRMDEMPRFDDWMAIRAQVLVQARLTRDGDRYRLQFYMWDINGREQIEAQILVSSRASHRRLGHIMSDAIYERLTGEIGYFDTQIIFIAETGTMDARVKRMAVMDQDGHGFRFISDANTFVMSPHFSPNMQTVIFLSFRNDDPTVWSLDMNTGEQRRLGQFGGMTFAPRFSPDGKRVALSMASRGGATNIYEYDLETRTLRQLTSGNTINTSPSYSPCGRKMAFNSTRSGAQQIHILDLETMVETRISFGSGRYATPAWSPDGNFIAFTRIDRGTFFIGIMDPRGRNERILASGWFMEAPSWAPGSRRVVYHQTERGENDDTVRISRIRSVDISGQNDYEIKLPDGISGTAATWSPRLP
ncbi:MAG: Tol-Pal system beta propeller repeat protein TolB [Alphaproteobacteria bacterium]|nr:Tol-Pal system beta propeller repeat protein TolB [Alphaproteobacteria bacterium]